MESTAPPPKRYILGRYWYYKLVESSNGIYRIAPPHAWRGWEVMVQLMTESSRFFSLFHDYIELYEYMMTLNESLRTFNEVVPAERRRKPYFDLDSSSPARDGEDDDAAYARNRADLYLGICLLVRSLLLEIPQLNLERDILVCESDRAGIKASAHIVVDHFCMANKYETERLYYDCLARIEENYDEWASEYARVCCDGRYTPPPFERLKTIIDPAVYNANQNFRILGCQKPGKNNIKRMRETWRYFDRDVTTVYDIEVTDDNRFIVQLSRTMLTVCSYCTPLPARVPSDADDRLSRKLARRRAVTASDGPILPLPDVDVLEAVSMLSPILGKTSPHSAFSVRSSERADNYTSEAPSGKINLDRHLPSWCPICERVHDSENPYIRLWNGKVYFACRRSFQFDKDTQSRRFNEFYLGDLSRIASLRSQTTAPGSMQKSTNPFFQLPSQPKSVKGPLFKKVKPAVIASSRVFSE